MEKMDSTPENIDIAYEKKEIGSIKKLVKELENLRLRNKGLLSTTQDTQLCKTIDTLSALQSKKEKLIHKRQAYDKKSYSISKELDKLMQTLDEKEKLTIILTYSPNMFTLGTDTLQKGVEEFLFFAPRDIIRKKTTPKAFVQNLLEASKKNDHPQYSKFKEQYDALCAAFGLA